MDLLNLIFDSSDFATRGECGNWSPTFKIIYIVANMLIAFSYFTIPVTLLYVWRKGKDNNFSWILVEFAAFIFLCGLTHVTDIIVFWWAPYRLFTLIFLATGIISLITALSLPLIIPKRVRLLTRETYQKMVNELQNEISNKDLIIVKLNLAIKDLKNEVNNLEIIKKTGIWYYQQETLLVNLKETINKITMDDVKE